MKEYLKETEIIDYSNSDIKKLAKELSKNCKDDVEIARNCFLFVRDNIRHTGDCKNNITTCKASEVLKFKTGWCYAKSHLLAALLRANNIPTGFCYQRLSCNEYKKKHLLFAWIKCYLSSKIWLVYGYARGNKEGVNAEFCPPIEKLAFHLQADEFDLPGIYSEPLKIVIETLMKFKTYNEMINNFPDI